MPVDRYLFKAGSNCCVRCTVRKIACSYGRQIKKLERARQTEQAERRKARARALKKARAGKRRDLAPSK